MKNTKQILFNFSQTTSSHGIPHIGRARNWGFRFFWAAIFVVALGLLVWQIWMLVEKYLEYDKVTRMEVRFREKFFMNIHFIIRNPFS